jgi:hypothetical protein
MGIVLPVPDQNEARIDALAEVVLEQGATRSG